jgi:uncharacterized protein YdaU (DUF1376 family)
MNFYAFHVGDYLSHTRHLTPLEDLAYRRMLDWYYLHERPFNGRSTDVARLIGMREQQAEVEAVLAEFFEEVEGRGWVNKRADEEIATYLAKRKLASEAGKRSASSRNKGGNGRSTDVQPALNGRSTDVQLTTPITTTTPIDIQNIASQAKPRAKRSRSTKVEKPEDVSIEVWESYVAHRRTRAAVLNKTVLDGLRKQAAKAGWTLEAAMRESIERGWTGFKAEWVANNRLFGNGTKPKSSHDLSGMDYSRGINPDGTF